MAQYWLYNNKYYNPSDGAEVTPSETFTSTIGSLYSNLHYPIAYKSDWTSIRTCQGEREYRNNILYSEDYYDGNIEDDLNYDLNLYSLTSQDGYHYTYWPDDVSIPDEPMTYFKILYWYDESTDKWYKIYDPDGDDGVFNLLLPSTEITSQATIDFLNNRKLESRWYSEISFSVNVSMNPNIWCGYTTSNDSIRAYSRITDNITGNTYYIGNVSTGYSALKNAYDVSKIDIALNQDDDPLSEYQLYKYNNKYYDANNQEVVPSLSEVSSTQVGYICINKAVKSVRIDGINYYKTNIGINYDTMYCVNTAVATSSSLYNNALCYFTRYIKMNDSWYDMADPNSPVVVSDTYLLNKISQIEDKLKSTADYVTSNFAILRCNTLGDTVYSYQGLSHCSSVVLETSTDFENDFMPLYIANFTEPVKVERPFVSEYTKTQGSLQRNNQPMIKVYNTLALANADIANISANEVVIVKGGTDKSMYRKVNGALTKLFTGAGSTPSVDQYQVGDIRFVYDKNQVTSDWLLCDGSTFNQADYPDLYTLLGTTTLPLMTNKCIYHSNSVVGFKASQFPSHKHTLDTTGLLHTHEDTELPSHTHTMSNLYLGQGTKGSYQSYSWRWSTTTPQSDGPTVTSSSGNTLSQNIYSGDYGTGTDLHLNEASVWVYIKAR